MRGSRTWKGVGLPLAALTAASLIAACGSSSSSSPSGSGTAPSGGVKVSIALDFIPNADNEGVFVADKLGYFSQAGIDADIVPYGQTPPDTLASTGKVQFAIGDTESDVLFDFASGLKITSVMAVLQTNPSFFGTLTSNKTITSPKDFCNQTYGGFGYPGDPAIIAAVIQGAGGPAHCNVPVVTLGSSAYQAVESHRVGFSAFFFSDIIQAEVEQHASLRVFNENDYGVPNQYAALILGNDAWLAANPVLAHKFVNALVRAYTFIKNNPAEGARIEYEMNPTAVNLNVAIKSSEAMAKSYLTGPSGQIGVQDPQTWQAFGTFLYNRGAFTNASGQKLTHNLDWGSFMTDKYL
jgi:ABC-type nitrate/sulfonate/bicarbonate transport system substrate-binding protein